MTSLSPLPEELKQKIKLYLKEQMLDMSKLIPLDSSLAFANGYIIAKKRKQ